MKEETYKLTADKDLFIFFSVGKKGILPKVIVYEIIEDNLYNLAFGDLNIETGEISDYTISNNGDMKKIIATVIKSLQLFLDKKPNAKLRFKGSTLTRTKLYQRIISTYTKEFSENYIIFGIEEGKNELIEFIPSKNYIEFYISKK